MKCSFCGAITHVGGQNCAFCGKPLMSEQSDGTSPLPSGPAPMPSSTAPDWSAPRSERPSGIGLWGRYFAHGALFSLLILFGAVIWMIITIPLVLCGGLIGLAIALFLLVLLFGYANVFISEWIWGMKIDHEWKSVFIHGLFLIIVLLVASVPSIVVRAVTDNVAVAIALFLAYCLLDGIIARWIADFLS
jgi:hypothetical protein